jgi:hypothetical protein
MNPVHNLTSCIDVLVLLLFHLRPNLPNGLLYLRIIIYFIMQCTSVHFGKWTVHFHTLKMDAAISSEIFVPI